jgi:hypothetical protein
VGVKYVQIFTSKIFFIHLLVISCSHSCDVIFRSLMNITYALIRSAFQWNLLKVNTKLSLCLIKHHVMKTYWGVDVQLHSFITSALGGGEWSASHPGRFTPSERAPRYPLDRRPGGLHSHSGRGGEEKNSQSPLGIEPLNPDRSGHSLVAIQTDISRI